MQISYIKGKKLPDKPGVYVFTRSKKGGGKEILYIGRATSLRDRVRSYFANDLISTRGPLIIDMVTRATGLDVVVTDSVLEAVVLEANLIKKHQPKANTKEKDNKSFNYIVITNEDYPAVKIIRGRDLEKMLGEDGRSGHGAQNYKKVFGPFPQASVLREALVIVRKIFPFRDKCEPGQKKPCFNYQIGLCPGVCIGAISNKEYANTIKNITLFFEAKKTVLIRNLEKQMKAYAKLQEFEKAGEVRKALFALSHIKDVSLIKSEEEIFENISGGAGVFQTKRMEAYDIAHISGTNTVGVMTVMENGELKKSDYRKFKIKSLARGEVNDIAALKEVLNRRFAHLEWTLPDLIVADGGEAQKRAVEDVLKTLKVSIPIVSVVKDERHKAREVLGTIPTNLQKSFLQKDIILLNSEAHRYAIAFHRKLRGKI